MSYFPEFLEKDWVTIKPAFLTVGILLVLSFGLGVSVAWSGFWIAYTMMKEVKDEQIVVLEMQLEGMSDRLKENPLTSRFGRMLSQDLQREALYFVRSMQTVLDKAQRERSSILGLRRESEDSTRSKNERSEKFEDYSKKNDAFTIKYIAIYRERFQADAINFKDELLARLPPRAKTGIAHESNLYEEPTSLIDIFTIATDLERLAKALPVETELPTPSTIVP